MALQDARRALRRSRPGSTPRGSIRRAACSPASPACRSRATRPSSARTPSRTKSGIHQHGMLKHHSTYEIMRPEDVGLSRSNLVLGKHSGRHAFRERVARARLRARRRGAQPRLRRLQGARGQEEGAVRRRHRGAGAARSARGRRRAVAARAPARRERLRRGRQRPRRAAPRRRPRQSRSRRVGDGPVDAAFKAVEGATGVDVKLRKFEVRSVSMGEDAQGEAVVTVEYNGRTYRGDQRHDRHRRVGRPGVPRRRQPDRGDAAVGSRGAVGANRAPARSPSDGPSSTWTVARHAVRQDLGPARRRARDGGGAGRALHRPAPDPRSHLAAGLRRAAQPRSRGAAAGPHARDDGSLDADRSGADRSVGVPIAIESAARQVRQLDAQLRGVRGRAARACATTGAASCTSSARSSALTQPGTTIVCGDSHTSTHGAFGALAFGIGTTEVGHVLATQCLLQRRPRTMAVDVSRPPRSGRHRQGPDPRDHRPHRRQRRHRSRDRVPRLRRSRRCRWTSA